MPNQQNEKRQLLKKTDIIILAALLIAALCAYFYIKRPSETENYAVVTVGNNIVATYYLGDKHEQSTVDMQQYGFHGKLEFKDGAVRFVDVECPDKICEAVGFVKNDMEVIVCLPNQTSLSVYTPEDFHSMK